MSSESLAFTSTPAVDEDLGDFDLAPPYGFAEKGVVFRVFGIHVRARVDEDLGDRDMVTPYRLLKKRVSILVDCVHVRSGVHELSDRVGVSRPDGPIEVRVY